MLDSVEEVRREAHGRKLKFVFFWKPRVRGDAMSPAVFSNWERSPFESEGRLFPTVEHYLMWRKAVMFDDAIMADRILRSPSPTAVKALGRQIAHFDQAVWDSCRRDVMEVGCLAKFAAHDEFRRVLLRTGDRVIAEASPHDRVWGIGLAESDAAATRPASWRGLNLLGFTLMRVRHKVRQ